MSDFAANLRALSLIRGAIRHVNYRQGVTGRLNADGTLNPDPAAGTGYVWVRFGEDRGATRVKALRTRADAAGVDVIVAHNLNTGEDEIIEVDPVLALAKFGSSAAALNSPLIASVGAGKLYADAERGGLTVRVTAFRHGGGWWDGTQVTALTPTTTAGKKSYVCVGIDPAANAYITALTVDRALAYPLSPSECDAVIAAQPEIAWIGAVELAHGAAIINPAQIITLAHTPILHGATGSSAGFAGLVPTPAAGDQSKFLRGDATWQTVSGGGGSVQYPTRATLWHDQATIVSGSALTLGSGYISSHPYGLEVYQNPPANGDSFTQSFTATAGTYTLSLLGTSHPNRGKIDWTIDGVLAVSGQDWYSGGYVLGVIKTASVTIASDGYHVLKGIVNGKHGASSNYYIALTKYWLKQSTD